MTDNAHTPHYDPPLERLNAVRLLIVLAIGFGYGSTMPIGPDSLEWLFHLGHDPSWFGVQVLFFLSGWLGWRSLSQGRTGAAYLMSRAKRIYPWVALYTAIVVILLYPILCAADGTTMQTTAKSALYLFKTVTLIDPGGVMPGALDQMMYMCLLQGTIWTLRWGLIAHIGLVIVFALRMRSRWMITAIALASVMIYATLYTLAAKTALDLGPIAPAIRVAYPFLIGAALYSWGPVMALSAREWFIIATLAFTFATLHYFALPWTPTIEILGTLGWCAVAMMGLNLNTTLSEDETPKSWLNGWPPIVLPTYLGLWPICQIWLYYIPEIPQAALIVLTLTTASAVAYSFYWLTSGLLTHRRVQTA